MQLAARSVPQWPPHKHCSVPEFQKGRTPQPSHHKYPATISRALALIVDKDMESTQASETATVHANFKGLGCAVGGDKLPYHDGWG